MLAPEPTNTFNDVYHWIVGDEPLTPIERVELPPVVVMVLGLAVGCDVINATHETALATLRRPPVMVLPARLPSGSTLLRLAIFTCPGVIPPFPVIARTRAALPPTCGVAIEVPLRD